MYGKITISTKKSAWKGFSSNFLQLKHQKAIYFIQQMDLNLNVDYNNSVSTTSLFLGPKTTMSFKTLILGTNRTPMDLTLNSFQLNSKNYYLHQVDGFESVTRLQLQCFSDLTLLMAEKEDVWKNYYFYKEICLERIQQQFSAAKA